MHHYTFSDNYSGQNKPLKTLINQIKLESAENWSP